MHWQISTQTSTKYCFCVSRDKKIQCISSASKQQQFKDNESLYLWIYLKSKTSISIEEKDTAHLEGLKMARKMVDKGVWKGLLEGWSSCCLSSLQNITDVITVSYGSRGSRCQVGVGWPGARLPRLLCLGSDQFPAKTASRLVRVSDQEICELKTKVHQVLHSRRSPLLLVESSY